MDCMQDRDSKSLRRIMDRIRLIKKESCKLIKRINKQMIHLKDKIQKRMIMNKQQRMRIRRRILGFHRKISKILENQNHHPFNNKKLIRKRHWKKIIYSISTTKSMEEKTQKQHNSLIISLEDSNRVDDNSNLEKTKDQLRFLRLRIIYWKWKKVMIWIIRNRMLDCKEEDNNSMFKAIKE